MQSMKVVVALGLSLVLAACAVPLTDGGKRVQLMKADPAPGCEELGSVHGQADGANSSATLEKAKNDMRNNAAKMGANYVRMETAQADTGEVMGTAYRCPDAPAPAAAANEP